MPERTPEERLARRTMSATGRAAMKDEQIARLAAKGSPDYPILYAKQPHIVAGRATQEAEREAQELLARAAEAAGIAKSEGAAEVFLSTVKKGKKS